MKKVILCPNATRDTELKNTLKVRDILSARDIETVICPLFESEELPLPQEYTYSDIEKEMADTDMVVTFGGDGTILRAARIVSEKHIPILAVNMGTMGFMAELETDELDQIFRVLDGDYEIERRMMLDVTLTRGEETVCTGFALNDVVIGNMAHTIDLEIYGDEHAITNYSGDGVIMATPTGSTAYSMSAGGPVAEPSAKNIIVTPICAHVLVAKSFVLAPDRVITAVLGTRRDYPAYLAIDGNSVPLYGGDIVTVRRSARETWLIQLSNKSFYKKVHEKLGERT